jgi:hypothetical protein
MRRCGGGERARPRDSRQVVVENSRYAFATLCDHSTAIRRVAQLIGITEPGKTTSPICSRYVGTPRLPRWTHGTIQNRSEKMKIQPPTHPDPSHALLAMFARMREAGAIIGDGGFPPRSVLHRLRSPSPLRAG